MKANKLAFLNLIRFVLALSIVFWHLAGEDPTTPVINEFRKLTIYGGNQAFLLISGMLFALVYYPKLTSGATKPGKFLAKRALKFYPLVIVTVLFSYVFSLIARFTYDPTAEIGFVPLLEDLFFFGGTLFGGSFAYYNVCIWFLCPLMLCYLIALATTLLTRKKASPLWFLIPLLLFFWLAVIPPDSIQLPFFIQRIGNECFSFFLGFFFMYYLKLFETFPKKVRIPIRIAGAVTAIAFIIGFHAFNIVGYLGSDKIIGNILCWMPLFVALYGWEINIAFDNAVFKHLGAMSFHMYLWHWVAGKAWYCIHDLNGIPYWYPGLFLAAFGASLLSYEIVVLWKYFRNRPPKDPKQITA